MVNVRESHRDTFPSSESSCEIGDTVAKSALRAVAVAGVLAAGLLIGGLTAVPAVAQPDDSGSGSSQDSGSSDGNDGSGGGESTDSTVGDGAGSADTDGPDITDPAPEENAPTAADPAPPTSDPGESGSGSRAEITQSTQESKKTDYSNSITIPMLRLPAPGEIPMGGWPTVSTFYTTLEIPVPTFQEFLSALRIVPTPPPPGPAFRTQDEAPVVDATTGTTGGGGGAGPESTVFQAPLVTVPRAVTVAGPGPKAALGAPAVPAAPGVTQPGVAGAQTPVIRGSVQPTPGIASVPASTPMGGQQPARIGYQQYVRGGPTVAELAVVALPGVAGLMLVTFGGGLIGYRQANSVRFVRTAGAERFLP